MKRIGTCECLTSDAARARRNCHIAARTSLSIRERPVQGTMHG